MIDPQTTNETEAFRAAAVAYTAKHTANEVASGAKLAELTETTDLTASIAKARSRTLMAAKNFSRLMSEFEGELKYCGEALTEVMDAADQLMTLEALQDV